MASKSPVLLLPDFGGPSSSHINTGRDWEPSSALGNINFGDISNISKVVHESFKMLPKIESNRYSQQHTS
jgi:hypothetical protein